MKYVLLCVSLLFVGGCASRQLDASLHEVRYHVDARVELSELVEAVTPLSMPDASLRALLVPFAVRQDIGVRKTMGRELGDVFRRAWLEQRIFPVLEYASEDAWPGLDRALSVARAKGANILVTGNVSHFFESGGVGRTSVGVTMEVYWVPSSALIWSAAQAGSMEGAPDVDYVVVRSSQRLPSDPTFAVARAVALSMARGFFLHLDE